MTSASQEPIKNARAVLEAMLLRGDISGAVAYAQAEPMDTELANWLIRQAQGWHAKGLLDEQRRVCEVVLVVLPGNVEALHLLGFHAQLQGDYARAETFYSKALAENPEYAFSKLAHAQLRMMQSGFKEGREGYEARFDAVTEASGPDWRGLPIARWHGESVGGKHMYMWAEQGLGDIIMFGGFLHCLLKQSPRRLVLGMFPKLVSLFARSFPQIAVESLDDVASHALAPAMQNAFPHIEKLAEQASVPFSLEPLRATYAYVREHGLFDVAAPMGDLLAHCMPRYVPAQHQMPYLIADAERIASIRKRLEASGQGRRIGISWHTQNTRETTRNIPLGQWLPLLSVPGCHFISLQPFVPAQEITQFCTQNNCRITVEPTVDIEQDAEGLAALIAALDEVITIDNSNVHLAGALGVKTTLLLPKGANFRWPQCKDNTTLWYKSVTTLRQQVLSDWQGVMAEIVNRVRTGA